MHAFKYFFYLFNNHGLRQAGKKPVIEFKSFNLKGRQAVYACREREGLVFKAGC